MRMERSVVGKLKDGVLLLQVEATHCQDPVGSQSLDFVVHTEGDLLKHTYNHNETYFPFTATEKHQMAVHRLFPSVGTHLYTDNPK
jgi:hypothetical protein